MNEKFTGRCPNCGHDRFEVTLFTHDIATYEATWDGEGFNTESFLKDSCGNTEFDEGTPIECLKCGTKIEWSVISPPVPQMGKGCPDNAFIWLQEDEEEGVADCGCQLINDERGARFIMCEAHAATQRNFLDRIETLMSGVAWAPDTLDQIADILREAGYDIKEPTDEDEST